MKRREFITLVGGTEQLAWPLAAQTQEPGRTYRLGMMMPFPRDHPFVVGFLSKLRKRGFIEGPSTLDQS